MVNRVQEEGAEVEDEGKLLFLLCLKCPKLLRNPKSPKFQSKPLSYQSSLQEDQQGIRHQKWLNKNSKNQKKAKMIKT